MKLYRLDATHSKTGAELTRFFLFEQPAANEARELGDVGWWTAPLEEVEIFPCYWFNPRVKNRLLYRVLPALPLAELLELLRAETMLPAAATWEEAEQLIMARGEEAQPEQRCEGGMGGGADAEREIVCVPCDDAGNEIGDVGLGNSDLGGER